MELDLQGKRVIVTGASQGIGLSIASAFHDHGCKVVSVSRNNSNLQSSLSKSDNWVGISGDVTNPKSSLNIIKKALMFLGGIDILICNVGSGKSVSPGNESFEEWNKMFSTNFLSSTNIIESSLEQLKKSKGTIVCISSICGLEVIPKAPVTYSVSKAALNAYIRGISHPLGKDGIRINGIAPGNILFNGSVWEDKISKEKDLVNKLLKEDVPLGRFGSTEDISNLALWLSSSASSFCTGGIFICDGGQSRV